MAAGVIKEEREHARAISFAVSNERSCCVLCFVSSGGWARG